MSSIKTSMPDYSMFKAMSIIVSKLLVLLIIVLAFFGINIFVFLAMGKDELKKIIDRITEIVEYLALHFVNDIKKTFTFIKPNLEEKHKDKEQEKHKDKDKEKEKQQMTHVNINKTQKDNNKLYKPDDAYSSIQYIKKAGTLALCNIGIGNNCISGNIFPSINRV